MSRPDADADTDTDTVGIEPVDAEQPSRQGTSIEGGLVAACLGSFCVAAALALLVLGSSITRLPLEDSMRDGSVGQNLVVFFPGELALRTGVSATAATNVVGVPGAPDAGPDTGVYRVATVVKDSVGTLISANTFTVCLDRDTAREKSCDRSRAPGDTGPPFGGDMVRFPMHTERQDYEVFDPAVNGTRSIRYVRDADLDRLTLYRFEEHIPPTVTGRQNVPAPLAGEPGNATVPADLLTGLDRTFWVEPTSGVIVRRSDSPTQVLRGPSGKTGPPLFFGSLRYDDQTADANAALASSARLRIRLVETILPIGLGVGGLALVVGGVLAFRRSLALAGLPVPPEEPRPRDGGEPDTEEAEASRREPVGSVP